MTNNAKQAIKALTAAQIPMAGSQNKYAAKLGISAATITNLMQGKFELISDEMWRKLADFFDCVVKFIFVIVF